jgi:hypothetical protein
MALKIAKKSADKPPAKSPTDQMEDMQSEMLLREANEELQRERLEKIWKQYAPYIIAAAVVVLGAIGGYQYSKSRAAREAQRAGDAYSAAVQAITDGKPADAQKLLADTVQSGPAGYAALARFQAAGAAVALGNTAEAVKLLDALIADSSADPVLRDTARIKAASLRVDTADWTEMSNRLNDLVSELSPWRHVARELRGLAAFKAGRLADAKQSFQEILSDPQKPPSLGQRAQVVMGQIVAAELQAKFPAAVPTAAPVPSPLTAPATGPTTGTPTVTVPAPSAPLPKSTPPPKKTP